MGPPLRLKRVDYTRTIPIVFAAVGDPVGSGFVASLARPGGNITGTSTVSTDLSAKRLQLLKEAFPKISRVTAFVSSIDPSSAVQLAEIQRAAKALKMEVLSLDMRRRDDFEQGFAQSRKWRADSLYFIQPP